MPCPEWTVGPTVTATGAWEMAPGNGDTTLGGEGVGLTGVGVYTGLGARLGDGTASRGAPWLAPRRGDVTGNSLATPSPTPAHAAKLVSRNEQKNKNHLFIYFTWTSTNLMLFSHFFLGRSSLSTEQIMLANSSCFQFIGPNIAQPNFCAMLHTLQSAAVARSCPAPGCSLHWRSNSLRSVSEKKCRISRV